MQLATGVGGLSTFDANVNLNGLTQITNSVTTQEFVSSSLEVGSGASINMGGNRIRNVDTPIDGTDAATKAYVDGLIGGGSARDDEQDDRLDEQDDRLDDHDDTLASHASTLTTHSSTLASHETRITQTEAKNTEQDGRLGGHDTMLAAHQTTLDTHTFEIAGLDSRVTTNTQQIAALDSRVTGLEAGLADLGQEMAANRREARGGIALALAAASLRYDDRPEKLSIAGGVGHFKGLTGLSFGVGYAASNSFRLNAAVSGVPQNGDIGFSAGMSWTLN